MSPSQILKIAAWNIHGLDQKVNDNDFVHKLNEFDICVLSETWSNSNICIANKYVYSKKATKNVEKSSGRRSGGIAIVINNSIRKGVKILKETDYGIWFKLEKSYFDMEKNVCICAVYLPPVNSNYALKLPYEEIEKDVLHYCNNCEILIIGDTNSRTGEQLDFFEKDQNDFLINDMDSYDIPKRFNSDYSCNILGKQLMSFCKICQLFILNGRTVGDVPGKFTCVQNNGCSVVDYAIASLGLQKSIVYFNVTPFDHLSDHALIKLCMNVKCKQSQSNNQTKLHPLPPKYIWNSQSKEKFLSTFNDKEIKNEIGKTMKHSYTNTDHGIDEFSKHIASIYQCVADHSLRKSCPKKRRSTKYSNLQTKTYHELKHEIKLAGKLLARYPNDPEIRGRYVSLKKKFHRKMKKAKLDERTLLMDKIQALQDNSPTSFWKLVNSIKDKKEKHEEIEPEIFFEYFSSLHKPNKSNNFDNEFAKVIENKLTEHKEQIVNEVMDKGISQKEILDTCRSLKNKKSAGMDAITNEMIKSSIHIMLPCLHKLFNQILGSEIFPENWCKGLIVPIYKSGDQEDPSNYRGITISNTIGKLFTKLLNNRLLTFITDQGILKNNQIGFMPKHRTSDHILVMKTIIDTFKRTRKTLFLCFIDLKKAFDTIYHNGLIYKLQQLKLSSKFINIIKSLYSKTFARVRSLTGITDEFKVEIGTRQGCNLSPYIFNLYLNDLADALNEPKSGIEIGQLKFNCLMYADDLVLLNKSEEGLKNSLQKLQDYCRKWRLSINVKKSKILIINHKKTKIYKFEINNSNLEIVKSYCYLGIEISDNGNFSTAIEKLAQKASKAYFSVRRDFNFTNNTNPKVMIKLFDSLVKPILLYGSEIWAVFGWRKHTLQSIESFMLKQKHKFEDLHTKICRNALGVHRKATEIMVKAELGRYPLMLNILINVYNYWQHILESDQASLIHKISIHNIKQEHLGQTNYFSRILNLFGVLNLKNLILKKCNQTDKTENMKILKNNFQTLYQKYFHDTMDTKTNRTSSGRFEIYSKVKHHYRYEEYLHLIKDNKLRRNITNIRISTHKLPIELLRKTNTPRDQRTCTFCKKHLGTEFHTLMECKNDHISKLRHEFNNKIIAINNQWMQIPTEQRFIYLMLACDKSIVFYLAVFLGKVFEYKCI